jgi:glutamyl-tRNA synthetase
VSLVYYHQAGFLPQAMLNFLGLMGGGMPADINNATEKFTLAEMVAHFDVKNIRPAGPVFDLTKLRWLNGEYLRALTPDELYAALRSTVLSDDYLKEIAGLVQPRIETLGEFGNMTHFFFADDVAPSQETFLPKKRTLEETLAFAAEQLTVLEATEWTHAALEPALKALGDAKGWSVKENFMLLRAIVTGSTMSPPLIESMIVYGKARTLDRARRFLDAQKKAGPRKND